VDIDMVTALVGTDIVGSFPAVEMRKVDMRAYNADGPLLERRELVLYRLLLHVRLVLQTHSSPTKVPS
jgi:hypothetical protein